MCKPYSTLFGAWLLWEMCFFSSFIIALVNGIPFSSRPSIQLCPGCLISHNMHSTVDNIAPRPVFEKCWLSTLCLIFTYGITSYHRERKIRHRQVGPTSSVSLISQKYSSIAHLQSEINTTFFFAPGHVLIGRFITSPLPSLISFKRVVRFC